MHTIPRHADNEKGAALLFLALLLVSLFSLFTLAVDVGVWLNTRSEAQRVADAAALAGAGIFMRDEPAASLVGMAEDTARYYAGRNYVGRTTVNSAAGGDVDVVVSSALQKVTVTVRGGTAPLFAHLLGMSNLAVTARAAARVINSGAAKCVKPFALPDIWQEQTPGSDTDLDDTWDSGEDWTFDPAVDHYKRWSNGQDATPAGIETGYGSTLRDGKGSPVYVRDQGRRITIKAGEPAGGNQGSNYDVPTLIRPGLFLPFVIPDDPTMNADCGLGNDGGTQGAAAFSQNICACNNSEVKLGEEYPLKTGNMIGPTKAGIEDLIALDPTASWNTSTNTIVSSYGMDSPRVIKIALYDPGEVVKSGKQSVVFNNIGLFFVEGYENSSKNVTGRFIKYAEGTGAGSGTLIKVLQLVE